MRDINEYEYVVITTGYLWLVVLPSDLTISLNRIRLEKITINGKLYEPKCEGALPNGKRKEYTQQTLSLICACLN